MAFDAFCYSPTQASKIPGETQDDAMSKKQAFEVLSFELGAENVINIGSISGGGGAGKATFKEFTITKKTDTASTGLFTALVTGNHFDDLVIELRRSGGAAGASGATFMKFEFKLVMVQDISWSGSDGDDICEETVIFQFGAIQIHYFAQGKDGKMVGKPAEAMWSRVKNNASLTV
ncbi:MAG: type VI secretion system tube protein Hcp [Pseudomonadota bacterium]|jgi:type VI secretion system secreted protein Hcp